MNNVLQLWRKRKDGQIEVEKAMKPSDKRRFTQLETDIYLFIAAEKVCITTIRRESFFKGSSLSSVKRAIVRLQQANLVYQVQDTVDKRIYWLTVR